MDSVHTDSATGNKKTMTITAAKRKSLPRGEFALPGQRKYPIDTAARTRNAAARLEQNKSGMSSSEYASAKSRIASAAKKFGIHSEYNKKSARNRGGKGLHMKIGSDGSMSIRHMSDEKCLAVFPGNEIGPEELAITMSDEGKPVWNKLAVPGNFRGHPTGPFTMDADTFKQVERNFKRDGIDVVFDYEHASEVGVSDSPNKGKGEVVASGWIKDIQARPDGLYGLVDWTKEARQKILSKEIKYISPAIRFGAKDPKTGENVGAKLTSSALTLKPFLKELPPALASDSEYTAFLCSEIPAEELVEMSAPCSYAMSPDQFLPAFRRMLSLDDMSSPDQMMDKVERLKELVGMSGGNPQAIVQGVNLGNYIPQLREFMRMPANTTLDHMLNSIGEMIYSVIEHEASEMAGEEDEDSEGAEMSDILPEPAPQPVEPPVPVLNSNTEINKPMSTITMAEHEAKLTSAIEIAVNQAVAPLKLQIKDLESARDTAMTDKAAAEAKLVTLADQLTERDNKARADRVEEAFSTYKETKKLSDDDKASMSIVLSNNPDLFDRLYPKVPPAHAVLLRTVTASDTNTNAGGKLKEIPDFSKVLSDIKAKYPTETYDKQFDMAYAEHSKLMSGN